MTSPDPAKSYWMEFLAWEEEAARRGSGLTHEQMTGAAAYRSWLVNLGPDDDRPESPVQPVPDSLCRAKAVGFDGEVCGLYAGHPTSADGHGHHYVHPSRLPDPVQPVLSGLDPILLAKAIASIEVNADPVDADFDVARRYVAEYARLASLSPSPTETPEPTEETPT